MEHSFEDVVEDEVIRLRLGSGEDSKVNFKITNIASPGLYDVLLVTDKGTPVDGEGYDAEFLPPFDPSVYATNDYVDAQDDLKLNLTGGKLTGALSSKSGGATLTAFKVVNQHDDQVALKMWCPGGAGTQMKYVGNHNTDHWFQLYDEEDKNPVTPAKFAYKSFNLQAEDGVGYGGSDKHYFTGKAVFFDRVTYDGPVENDTDVATKAYVDSHRTTPDDATVSKKGIAKLGKVAHGASVPALETGQMFYNTSSKVLLIKT